MTETAQKLNAIKKLIGNTPLIRIDFTYKGIPQKIYTKLEYYNFTGSIKDRIAFYILNKAYLNNHIKKDYTIVEATSGNTGISFAAIGSFLGNKVDIYMPEWMSNERKSLLESLGANLHLISRDKGGFLQCIVETIKRSEKENKIFLPSQFSNTDNIDAHYFSTGPEIYNVFSCHNLNVDSFISGVGTGGTLMGVGKYLKSKNNNINLFALEPSSSPTLSKGTKNTHRIQGIMDEFIPPIFDKSEITDIVSVEDGDAIIMAQKLSKELGLGVGISSGANFIGALKALENTPSSNIVTIFPDDNKKYLSTDLTKIEPVKNTYISKDVCLLNISVL